MLHIRWNRNQSFGQLQDKPDICKEAPFYFSLVLREEARTGGLVTNQTALCQEWYGAWASTNVTQFPYCSFFWEEEGFLGWCNSLTGFWSSHKATLVCILLIAWCIHRTVNMGIFLAPLSCWYRLLALILVLLKNGKIIEFFFCVFLFKLKIMSLKLSSSFWL